VNWRTFRLKNVASINLRALSEDEPADLELRYVDISAVGRGNLVTEPQSLRFGEAPSRARRLVRPGDTIVSTVRTYLRAVWPVVGRTDDLVVSTGFAVISPGPSLDHRFLAWWAQSDALIEEIVARSVGVSYPAIRADEIGEVHIQLPDLREQREIASFLDDATARIDAVVEGKQRMIALVKEAFRASLDAAFVPGARRVRFGRFVTTLGQGTSPEAENREAAGAEWGVLKLSAVRFGRYRPTENKALPAGYSVDEALVPRPGVVLVTRSNTPEYVGDACAIAEYVPHRMLCDLIYMVRLDRRLDPQYAAYALLTSDARWQIQSAARGSSQSMVKLRGEDIKAVEIPYVSTADQRATVEAIEDRRSRADRLIDMTERQLELLREHRQALITAAVVGQLEPAKGMA
jgi:type I restriction enzyme, S subunit